MSVHIVNWKAIVAEVYPRTAIHAILTRCVMTPWFLATLLQTAVTVHTHPGDEARAAHALDAARELGVQMVRTDFWWRDIEPGRDEVSEEALEYFAWFLREARSRGLNVSVILSGPPEWAVALYERGEVAEFIEEFREYAALIGERYGAYVRLYQIWNEPNRFLDRVAREHDVEVMRAGVEGLATRDDDFEACVNILVDNHDWHTELQYYLDSGAGAWVRVWGIDFYPGTWSPMWPFEDWTPLSQLFETLATYSALDGRSYRAAISETGYSTWGFWADEAAQADYASRALPAIKRLLDDPVQTQGVPFDLLGWYELIDDPGTLPVEATFGLLHADLSRKPAFEVVQRELARFTPALHATVAPMGSGSSGCGAGTGYGLEWLGILLVLTLRSGIRRSAGS